MKQLLQSIIKILVLPNLLKFLKLKKQKNTAPQ